MLLPFHQKNHYFLIFNFYFHEKKFFFVIYLTYTPLSPVFMRIPDSDLFPRKVT